MKIKKINNLVSYTKVLKKTKKTKIKEKLSRSKKIKINNSRKKHIKPIKRKKQGLGKIVSKKKNKRKITRTKQKGGVPVSIDDIDISKNESDLTLKIEYNDVHYKIIIKTGTINPFVLGSDSYNNVTINDTIYLKFENTYYTWDDTNKLKIHDGEVHPHNHLFTTQLRDNQIVSCFLDLDIILNCKPLLYVENLVNEQEKNCCYFKIEENLYFYDKNEKPYIVVMSGGILTHFRNNTLSLVDEFVIDFTDLIHMFLRELNDVLYFIDSEPYEYIDGTRKIIQLSKKTYSNKSITYDVSKFKNVNKILKDKNLRIDVKTILELVEYSKKNSSLLSYTDSPLRDTPHLILYYEDKMVATIRLDIEEDKENLSIVRKTHYSFEKKGYASLLLNILIYIINKFKKIESTPYAYQTFFSCLKYNDISIKVETSSKEKKDFFENKNYIQGTVDTETFSSKRGNTTFYNFFLNNAFITRLNKIYLKYKSHNLLVDDEIYILRQFFEIEESKISDCLEPVNIYIPVENNYEFALIEIQKFIEKD